jgi:hypothetical protein
MFEKIIDILTKLTLVAFFYVTWGLFEYWFCEYVLQIPHNIFVFFGLMVINTIFLIGVYEYVFNKEL